MRRCASHKALFIASQSFGRFEPSQTNFYSVARLTRREWGAASASRTRGWPGLRSYSVPDENFLGSRDLPCDKPHRQALLSVTGDKATALETCSMPNNGDLAEAIIPFQTKQAQEVIAHPEIKALAARFPEYERQLRICVEGLI